MPNYEELYNIARTKYHQAIENKNNIQRTSSELQSRKNSLSRELSQKQEQLREAKNKLALLQETEDFCKVMSKMSIMHAFPFSFHSFFRNFAIK